MNEFTPRTVSFTEAARKDVLWCKLTRDEWQAIKAEIYRIAAVRNLNADAAVCKIAQCDGEWWRLKLRDPNVRLAFTVEENDRALVIRALLRRGERTYDQIEIIWQAAA